MRRKQKRFIQIIAIILAVLLVGSAIVSAVVSMASAEEQTPIERDRNTMKIEYLEEEQALRITQRLVYINRSGISLDRVVFQLPANILRRESALFYDNDTLEAAFPYGYLPGGITISSILVDGSDTDWGFQNDNETALRVACNLEPNAECAFEFDYYLLMTPNAAFLGIDDTGWRLSDFYFLPAEIDTEHEEFIIQSPVQFTRYIFTPAADYDVVIELPDSCIAVSTGTESSAPSDTEHMTVWSFHAENVHDFSIVFGAKYKMTNKTTASGVDVRVYTSSSKKAKDALNYAIEAIEACEAMFGSFPMRAFDIVETGCATGMLNTTGVLWLSEDAFKADDLRHKIRYAIAQMYFGYTAYAQPSADAWLSDSISEYIAYLITDRLKGHDAYLKELNEGVVTSLQYTIPGSFVVTSDASLLTASEYEAIIHDRGAAVFHEMSVDMGTENLISGLKDFYEKGLVTPVLTEMDLVRSLDSVTGSSWEKDLTDWVFNIGDYVDQEITWLD